MERPTPRRERTGIIQIMLIAAVLLAALYGGARLLGATHLAWEARQERRITEDPAARSAAQQDYSKAQAALAQKQLLLLAEARAQRAEDLRTGKLRCINGQLFRRLDNGWENLPGQPCL